MLPVKLSEKKVSKKVTEKKTNDIILSDNLLPIEVPIKNIPKRVKNTKIDVSKENVEVLPVELSEIKHPKKVTKKNIKITTEAPIVPLEVSDINISEKETIALPIKRVSKKKKLEKHIEILNPLSNMKLLENFKEQGITVLTSLDEATLSNLLKVANDMYYNGEPILTDNEFDIIKEYTANKFPKTEVLQEIGAPIQGKNKVELPFEMASMDKIKPDSGALPAWVAKYTGPYVLSCKLDGVSGMYVCDQKGKYSLYTRGNGLVGQDVSHLIKPLALPALEKNTAVRGEFILAKSVFAEKYADHFANARNLVSGIINRKSADEKANDLHFVAYEVVQPAMEPIDQMKTMVERGFRVVQHRIVDKLSNEYLSDLLLEWRKEYAYEIDGVIVTNNAIYPRSSGNPDHSFAFKMVISDQVAEAKVVDVLWEASKDGYLKPRVQIEPIQLGGVKIEYATGFNGKFIEDNRIGIGAIIMMVRSGDVIPYIKSITTPAEKAKMPLVPYIWNKTHVDVILEKPEENEVVQEKNVTLFFTTLEVDGLAKGNVKKLFRMGHNTVAKIIALSVADLELVEGFQNKTAVKLHTSIHEKLQAASLLDIMTASGKLGRGLGKTKLRPILEKYPDILTDATEEKEKLLLSVHGIGKENAREFVSNIPEFLAFLKECGLEGKLKEKKAEEEDNKVESELTGKKFVMTKVRDKDIINFVTSQGATLEDTMKKDIMVLIVKSKDDVSNKMTYAEKNGIPIMTVEEFKAKFME